jgi:hypothetical protein
MRERLPVYDITSPRIAGLLALAAMVWISSAIGPTDGYAAPDRAPDFRIHECIYVDSLVLSEFFEFPVLLFFFDAGDVACFEAYPYLVNWAPKYAADGFKVFGIHSSKYDAMRSWANVGDALTELSRPFPVALDYGGETHRAYGIEHLPTSVLIEPGGEVVHRTSDIAEYRDLEVKIQSVLREIEPDVVLPFLFEPAKRGRETGEYPPPTPRIVLGYASGCIANLDSAGFDKFWRYTDPGDRDKGKVYLEGRWKLEDSLLTYEEGEAAHIRVVYSGKDVWFLPDFNPKQPATVYIEQDRSPLRDEARGKDTETDRTTRTFVRMQYASPQNIVRNAAYGTHELKIIPEEGTVRFHYLFFRGAN